MNSSILITDENFGTASLVQWEHELGFIYSSRNAARDPGNMWLRAVSDSSKVGEAIRKGEYIDVMKYLTHTFAWILTTTHKLTEYKYDDVPALLGIDHRALTSTWDCLVEKYPGICPYCAVKVGCQCGVIREEMENETKAERRLRLAQNRQNVRRTAEMNDELDKSVIGITKMFDRIYGHTHYGVDMDKIAFHMLEEVGEVAWCLTSLREGTRTNDDSAPLSVQLAEEIADTVAWSFAIIGKIRNLYTRARKLEMLKDLDPGSATDKTEAVGEEYGLLPRWLWTTFDGPKAGYLRCPGCHRRPCSCGQ